MADLNEHVAYLSQEIGPRPAGTEEEQRAALYISENLSSATGLPTAMEDFQCNPDSTLPRALCSGVAVVATLIATIFSVVSIPAAVIALLCAVLMAAEIFGKPVLSRFLNRGVSQNVVTKYVPLKSTNRSSRRRKVILVANYDSGKVRRDLNNATLAVLPVLHWVEFAMLVIMPVLLIVRMVMSPQDTALIVFNVLLALTMVVAALPVIAFVVEKFSAYNEGANCNASGVAVLMEVAARVAAARDLPDAEDGFVHGEAAARSAGLVPEGVELVYDAPVDGDLDGSLESASQRLAAAKAAVAALSGKPVSAPTEDETVAVAEGAAADAVAPAVSAESGEGAGLADVAVPVAAGVAGAVAAAPEAPAVSAPAPTPQEHAVPDWFKKAQEQAKKPTVEKPIQRSRYADALATAEEEIAAREEAQRAAAEELSARMRHMRDSVQAASEAAGATPTGIIPDAAVQAASQSAAMEAVEVPRAQGGAPAASVPVAPAAVPADAAPAPAPASVAAPTAPADPAVPAVEAPAAAPAAPAHAVVAPLPEIAVPTDDPNVILREGQRPLTGAASTPSALGQIPNPLDNQPAASGRRLVVPEVEVAEGASTEAAAAVPAPAAATRRPTPRKRRAISLPNIGVSQELPRISMDEHQQAAPLAEERPAHDGRVRDLSAVVPAVATAPAVPQAAAPSAESALRSALPSLAGVPAQTDPGLSGSISLAGSFSSMGATGAAAPIGDELLEEVQADDLYIDDADDSAYVEQVTETGAIAGPGYVEMPKSRFGRIFGKLRHKGKEETTTPQQWLNVEEDFEAQEVGAARGGWESFREDDSYEAMGQTSAFTPEYFDEAFEADEAAPAPRPHHHGRPFEGGAFSRGEEEGDFEEEFDEQPRSLRTSAFADGLPENFMFEDDPALARIEQFHSQRIDIEVWFVALGSELAGNGGMKAFMEAHEAELKGSIIMEVQGMGAGELTLIDKEGTYLPKKSSSRMKRLVKKAGQAMGLSVPSATMTWMDSSSAYALKHGHQALHVAGMEGKKPAFFAQGDDVVENIDADMLSLNADFVMELLKQV